MDVKTSKKRKEEQDYRVLRKALCSGFANQLAERMIRHNGFRTLGFKSQLVQVRIFDLMGTKKENGVIQL